MTYGHVLLCNSSWQKGTGAELSPVGKTLQDQYGQGRRLTGKSSKPLKRDFEKGNGAAIGDALETNKGLPSPFQNQSRKKHSAWEEAAAEICPAS